MRQPAGTDTATSTRARVSASTIPFDGGMLLMPDQECIFLLNASATSLWNALKAGLSIDEILATLDAAGGPAGALILDRAERLLKQWHAAGLLSENEPTRPISEELPPVGDRPMRWAAQWKCRIRKHVIAFRVEHRSHVRQVKLLVDHLRVARGAPRTRIDVFDSGGGAAAVFHNGKERARVRPREGLRDTVHAALIEDVWSERPLLALIHAGAVSRNGAVFCFAASSGQGKSTLVAHLAAHGYMYLADDIAAIDSSGSLLPWPMPASIKEGSWAVLEGAYPSLSSAPLFRTKGRPARLLLPENGGWEVEPAPVNRLIFPHFSLGGATTMERLRPLEALERLIASGLSLSHPVTNDQVRSFLAWLERTPAVELTYGDLNAATAILEGGHH
jgi:hypothetical protein